MSPTKPRLAVIGGGAAGFFAAVNAARLSNQLEVTIFERSREVLSKVRISGGGRCNVTHHCFEPEILAQAYPRGSRELRWAFEQFQPRDTVAWFERRGISLKTESDGRMFPVTDDSATVTNCLKEEARKHNVTVRTKTKVEAITETTDQQYRLTIHKQEPELFDIVLVATGGSNRSSAYDWLQELGHSIVEPVPSLFTFNFKEKMLQDLAGISVKKTSVAIENTSFQHTGPVLITHWGLSAPAVLKTSAWAARYLHNQQYRFTIHVNWLHPHNEQEIREQLNTLRMRNARKIVRKQDAFPLPNRLWERILALNNISPKHRWAELSNRQNHSLAQYLTGAAYEIEGKTTYKDEFVTGGGIPLQEVNMGTMESKKRSNIYFAGEVLNIDGITGGYNFQSAWTTGWIAARDIAHG